MECRKKPVGGTTQSTNRLVDFDHDGRADVVITPGASGMVYFNHGGQFRVPALNLTGGQGGLRRFVKATAALASGDQHKWELRSDFIDLNGDGLEESVTFGEGVPTNGVRTESAVTQPQRLLATVDNGRGATTTIVYASMHDPTTVEQHTDEFWSTGRPKASPATNWVVKQVTVHDQFATADAATSYFYKNPRHGADDENRFGFRGFEEVTSTGPSGAKTVERYSFSPDWSGRLAATLTISAEAPTRVHAIDTTTWEARTLFSGAVTTFHATGRDHRICAVDQTEAQCTSTPACTACEN